MRIKSGECQQERSRNYFPNVYPNCDFSPDISLQPIRYLMNSQNNEMRCCSNNL